MQTRLLMRWGVGATLVGALAFGGCSSMDRMRGNQSTWTMATSEQVQAAQGKVQGASQKDGNARVKVEVARLAPPQTAYDNKEAYVVWIQPAGGQPQNVGVLNVDKKLNGELETRTPFKHFQV